MEKAQPRERLRCWARIRARTGGSSSARANEGRSRSFPSTGPLRKEEGQDLGAANVIPDSPPHRLITKPSRASFTAGSKSVDQGSRPWREWISQRPRSSPGTVTARPPTRERRGCCLKMVELMRALREWVDGMGLSAERIVHAARRQTERVRERILGSQWTRTSRQAGGRGQNHLG